MEKRKTKSFTSIKGKVIGSYAVILIFMGIIATVCVNSMKTVTNQLLNIQAIIDDAAVQAITKQSMRQSISEVQNVVSKCTNISLIVSICGAIIAIILAIIIITGIIKPLKQLN